MPDPSDEPPASAFIFQDLHGKRWPRLRRVLVVWGALGALSIVWFFRSLLIHPELKTPLSIRPLKEQLKAAIRHAEQNDPKATNWSNFYGKPGGDKERAASFRTSSRRHANPKGEIRLGMYVEWDPNSFLSLLEHAGSLTHIAPEWFSLHGTESKLVVEIEPRLAAFAAAHELTLMPLLHNLQGNTWQPEAVENLANGSADKRARFIRELLTALKKTKAGGLIIDWEQLDPGYQDRYTDLIEQLADELQAAGMELWFTVSLEDLQTFRIFTEAGAEAGRMTVKPGLDSIVDRFIAVLHDENSEGDAPGPIASQPWVEEWLKLVAERGDPQQWIGLLGAYAYDWNTTTLTTETISFKDAMSRASYAGVDRVEEKTEVAAPRYNGEYQYSEPGGEHTVSFLDAISFHNQLRTARSQNLAGIGIGRLGAEDPQIWDVLELKKMPAGGALAALGRLRSSETITNVGRGEIVTVDATRDDGERIVKLDPGGLLSASYTDFPTFPILYHQGAGGPHEVAITFDDGPDSRWTPQVLDILRERGVKAAFFLVGNNCEDDPELVAQIVAEGHEVGNHTYSHRNLAIMSQWQMELELTATQRLIESITGRSTSLFRPPYNADSNPTSIAELAPLKFAQEQLGYTIVLEKIDPQDWAKPGADEIVQRVKDLRDEGNIILLHDAGGDRSQTVAALPKIIDYLRARGDRIVSLSELLRIPRDDLMPPVDVSRQPFERMISDTGFRIWHGAIEFFWAFMIFATGLVLVRTLLVAWLARRHHREVDSRRSNTEGGCLEKAALEVASRDFAPPLTIAIAAFNEGKVIAKTLRSVLESDYAGEFEILVVDDGSIDDTAAEIERIAQREAGFQPASGEAGFQPARASEARRPEESGAMPQQSASARATLPPPRFARPPQAGILRHAQAETPRHIRLIQQPNRGKSAALRNAVAHARHGILVFLDADTQCEPATLRALVQPFANPLVGAVSGNARVGNLRAFISRCQSLEYICGFNLDRRAYSQWNCITVVPGAISAIRRSAIQAAGGFSNDTLAEDTDLTLTLHRLGYRIAYAPNAIAWTEAPETFRTLARQRSRWAFGTMQCLWKHRDLVFNPRFGALGWFSLPNIWFMQIGLVAVTPAVDLLLLYSLFLGHAAGIWYWFAAVLGTDLFLATLACWMEGEPLRRAWLILPMRFVYRPLLAWVIWKSILHALKGALVGWGKLERTASVPARG